MGWIDNWFRTSESEPEPELKLVDDITVENIGLPDISLICWGRGDYYYSIQRKGDGSWVLERVGIPIAIGLPSLTAALAKYKELEG